MNVLQGRRKGQSAACRPASPGQPAGEARVGGFAGLLVAPATELEPPLAPNPAMAEVRAAALGGSAEFRRKEAPRWGDGRSAGAPNQTCDHMRTSRW
jgi:hypothetical protein